MSAYGVCKMEPFTCFMISDVTNCFTLNPWHGRVGDCGNDNSNDNRAATTTLSRIKFYGGFGTIKITMSNSSINFTALSIDVSASMLGSDAGIGSGSPRSHRRKTSTGSTTPTPDLLSPATAELISAHTFDSSSLRPSSIPTSESSDSNNICEDDH